QINRWVALGGERVLREIQAMAPRLVSLDAWRNEFLTSAERALAAGRTHDAAILLRSAEFFMTSADPRKRPSRERFLALMRQAYGVGPPERVPFAGGYLPFHRFVPPAPRATVVMFGGFDSYVEDFLPILTTMRDRGFDVVAFDAMTDLLECMLGPLPRAPRRLVRALLAARADRLIDALPGRAAREPVREWGIAQGMHIFGVGSRSAMLRAAATYRTEEASPLVRQDVLLLAGAEDHYVPTPPDLRSGRVAFQRPLGDDPHVHPRRA